MINGKKNPCTILSSYINQVASPLDALLTSA